MTRVGTSNDPTKPPVPSTSGQQLLNSKSVPALHHVGGGGSVGNIGKIFGLDALGAIVSLSSVNFCTFLCVSFLFLSFIYLSAQINQHVLLHHIDYKRLQFLTKLINFSTILKELFNKHISIY